LLNNISWIISSFERGSLGAILYIGRRYKDQDVGGSDGEVKAFDLEIFGCLWQTAADCLDLTFWNGLIHAQEQYQPHPIWKYDRQIVIR
jgi:hypothetical protein